VTGRIYRVAPAMRSRLLWEAALIWALATTLGPAPPASAAQTMSGKVIMGTAGASLPAELRVRVVELPSAGGQVEKQATFSPDGTFTFEADSESRYLVGTVYSGVTYSTFIDGGAEGIPELKIFETTRDPTAVSVAADTTTILKGREDIFEVLQLLLVHNSSDRTFTGAAGSGSPEVLRVPIPEGAFDVSPADDANHLGISFSGRGVAVSSPLLPGETPIPYVFKVRVPRTGWQLRREVSHPTQRADLLLGEGLELRAAPGFEFDEQVTLEGRRYRRYRSGQLRPGSVIGADLGFPSASSRSLWWGLATGLAALGALMFGFSVLRRSRPAKGLTSGGPGERDALIEEIAVLDDRFEDGLVAEGDYRSRRNQMLARLSVMRRPSGGTPPGSTSPK
jgi:hypothetical protein